MDKLPASLKDNQDARSKGINKTGRPPGSGERQRLFREHVEPHIPELLKKAVDLAKRGDIVMLKFILDRGLPKTTSNIPLVIKGSSQDKIQLLIDYCAQGDISSDDVIKLVSTIEKSAMLSTLEELKERLSRAEAALKDGGTVINGEVTREPHNDN